MRRAVTSILNKLTAEKFDRLSDKLMECGFCTQAHVEMLVHGIFEEAAASRNHAGVYADLCLRLIKDFGDAEYLIKRTLRIQGRAPLAVLLQPLDLDLATLASGQEEAAFDAEAAEARIVKKVRLLGHVRFLGHLLTREVLTPQDFFLLTDTLLDSATTDATGITRDNSSTSATPSPDGLEALGALLSVVGPLFDRERWPQRARLTSLLERLGRLAAEASLAPRTRYLLRDVLELRDAGWGETRREPACSDATTRGPEAAAENHGQGPAAAAAARPTTSAAPGKQSCRGGGHYVEAQRLGRSSRRRREARRREEDA